MSESDISQAINQPTDSELAEMAIYDLCDWLRENSSGAYRKAEHAADLIESLQAENERLRESLAIAKFSFSQTYSGVDSVPLDRLSDYVRAMCQNAIDEINSTNSPID